MMDAKPELPGGHQVLLAIIDEQRVGGLHLGDPQRAYPVVHLTGTNGKGSTARLLTSLLGARGLRVG